MKIHLYRNAKLFSWVLVTLLLLGLQPLGAQTKPGVSIKGTVRDNTGVPLIGATVVVVGTLTGQVTDKQGNFSISVPASSKSLQISYIGYDTKVVVIGTKTFIDVVLQEDTKLLTDVVVIGYGTVAKKDLTGSIQSVGGVELEKAMNTNVTESLNGRVSGVLVTKASNRPGADMSVQIRGLHSFNFSNEPLYVIDGIPSQSGMRYLNAADIESIDILKDASSCAIYGSRGSNGVIIISTKGATKKEGFTVDFSGSVGLKTPTRIPDMIGNMGNGMEYVDYKIALWKKKYGAASLSRPDFLTQDEKNRIKDGEYYDWLRELSSNSIVTNYSVRGSGGTDKTSYSIGIGYMSDEGMIGNEKFERITANVGLEHRISKKFTMGLTTYISTNNTDMGSNEALYNAYLIPPVVSPYDMNGDYLFNAQPTSSRINPFLQIKNNIKQKEEFFANMSSFLEYKPVKALSVKTRIAYQHTNDITGEWAGMMTQQKAGINPPGANRSEGRNMNIVWDNILTYNTTFNNIHKFNAIALYSMQKETHQGSGMAGDGLPYESLWHAIQTADEILGVSSYYWEAAMNSAMMRLNYTLNDKYLFTLTGRYDGTSRLAIGRQWGFMPSAAIGWQMKNENFLKNIDFVDNLKLRLSYGKTGNNNINNDITMTKLDLTRYSFGGKGENGFQIGGSRGNQNLRWEMTSEYNLGADFGFFKNRIIGTVDAYKRTTKDLIFNRAVGSINGFSGIFQNVGTTSNEGIEIGLNTVNISKGDFTWKTSGTFSMNKNKIEDLYGDKKDDLGNRWFIGQPINAYYDLKQIGIWQEEEKDLALKYGASPGQIKVVDVNGDFSIDERDYMIVGARTPDWTAGMTNTFTFRNFDMSFYAYARVGGIYSDSFTYQFTCWDGEHWNKLDVPYWTPENRNNKYPTVGSQSLNTQVVGQVSGTFLKVQNITCGYTLSPRIQQKLNLKQARAYISVQNPLTFSSYLGSDPEIIGEDVYTQMSLYPMTFTLGLNLKF